MHQRFLLLAIPALAWPSVLHELVRVTRSGGWVEVLETQVYPENIGPCTKQLTSWVVELGRKRGIECGHPPKLAEELHLAGLTNIMKRQIAIPFGKWGGSIGTLMQTNVPAGVRAMRPLIVSQLGIPADEFDRLLARVLEEYDQLQMTVPYVMVCGQRPSFDPISAFSHNT